MNTVSPVITTALDNLWYERFRGLVFEDYEKLSGDGTIRAEQKRLFLEELITNPTLDYPELDYFDSTYRARALTELLVNIEREEKNETVKDLYQAKIAETLSMVRMLEAAKLRDDVAFSKEAHYVYGDPKSTDVDYVISFVRAKVVQVIEKGDEEQKAAALRLLTLLPEVNNFVDEAQALLPALLPAGPKVLEAELVASAFEAELKRLGIDDWTVLVDMPAGVSNFSVSQEYKAINIPATKVILKRAMSVRKLQGLIAHEIGAHVIRRFNGTKSKLKLLGLGLDGYIKGDEGVATYYEQLVTGANSFAGVARFFSIAVALGLVDGEKRDFREVFEVLCDYRLLFKRKSKNRLHNVRSLAYNDCVRIFRGTTCVTKGAIYPKDTAYFTNRAIWQLVQKDPEIEKTFRLGKFDPTNQKHVSALKKLEIL